MPGSVVDSFFPFFQSEIKASLPNVYPVKHFGRLVPMTQVLVFVRNRRQHDCPKGFGPVGVFSSDGPSARHSDRFEDPHHSSVEWQGLSFTGSELCIGNIRGVPKREGNKRDQNALEKSLWVRNHPNRHQGF